MYFTNPLNININITTLTLLFLTTSLLTSVTTADLLCTPTPTALNQGITLDEISHQTEKFCKQFIPRNPRSTLILKTEKFKLEFRGNGGRDLCGEDACLDAWRELSFTCLGIWGGDEKNPTISGTGFVDLKCGTFAFDVISRPLNSPASLKPRPKSKPEPKSIAQSTLSKSPSYRHLEIRDV